MYKLSINIRMCTYDFEIHMIEELYEKVLSVFHILK